MRKVVRIIIIMLAMIILTNASATAWEAKIHITEPDRFSVSKPNTNEIEIRQDVANGINLVAKILAVTINATKTSEAMPQARTFLVLTNFFSISKNFMGDSSLKYQGVENL